MLLTLFLCAVLIAADRLLKHLAVLYLMPIGTAPVWPGVVGLRYIENDGAAFSLLSGMRPLLIVVTGLALLVGVYILLFRRPADKLEYISIVMVFSGGVGNLIDRIAAGYVVDYIEFLFMQFGIFNFADILICVGFALLAISVFRAEARVKRAGKEAEEAESEPVMDEEDTGKRQNADADGDEELPPEEDTPSAGGEARAHGDS